MNAEVKRSDLIDEDDLKVWLGYEQRQKIAQWLSERGIPYQTAKGRIVTTIQAINAGMIGAKRQVSGFEFL